MLGIFICLTALVAVGGISYYYLSQIEITLQLAAEMSELSADIMEIRHNEKSYFLYGINTDYTDNLVCVDRAMASTATIFAMVDANRHIDFPKRDKQLIPQLLSQIYEYKEKFSSLRSPSATQGAAVRAIGQKMLATSQLLVGQLREAQQEMVLSLRHQLVFPVLILLLLVAITGWLAGGRILRALTLIEDATRQIVRGEFVPLPIHSTEKETHHVIEAINQMINELTLRQKQILQEKKLSSLGVLTAGVAHQLNNPLNNMHTTCQLLHEEVEEASAGLRPPPSFDGLRQKTDIIMQEIRRSRCIIKGLLDFSRESSFTPTLCTLQKVVQKAVKLLGTVVDDLQLSMEIPHDLQVMVDVQSFQEVCINVLINACQAIPKEAGAINICAYREKESVVLRIQDNGQGIPPEHLRNIFDPFFTRKEGGTGLGLSIAFGIISKHGGTINVTSEKGKGAVFFIQLPATATYSIQPEGNTHAHRSRTYTNC